MFCLRKGSTACLTDTPVQLVIDKTFRFGSGQVEKFWKASLKVTGAPVRTMVVKAFPAKSIRRRNASSVNL